MIIINAVPTIIISSTIFTIKNTNTNNQLQLKKYNPAALGNVRQFLPDQRHQAPADHCVADGNCSAGSTMWS